MFMPTARSTERIENTAMLNAVIRFALKYRMLVVVVSLALLGYGSYLAAIMPIDVFPDLDRPRVVILTECPGLAAEEVETLVSQPIEIALLGASGVQAVRSQAAAGLSVIYIEFDWTTEVRAARQTVQERLVTLSGVLPAGIRPQMTPPSSIMGQIVIGGLYRQSGPNGGELAVVGETGYLAELVTPEDQPSNVFLWEVVERRRPQTWRPVSADRVASEASDRPREDEIVATSKAHTLPGSEDVPPRIRTKWSMTVAGRTHEVEFASPEAKQMELRTIADWVIRPRLLKIPGVAEVFVQGGERKQYQVLIDPAALIEYDVTLQQVEQALKDNNLNTSGGFAVQGETERPIRVLGRLGPDSRQVLKDLARIPIKATPDRTILLEQVARVVEGPQFKRGDGAINGQPGVVLTVAKQPHMDTRGVSDQIARALHETEESLPADILVATDLFQLRNFIDRGIYNVGEALVIGAVLVLLVLFLFLLNVRTTFITLTAIPLSLVMTTLVFRLIGWLTGTHLSINVMTLGGVAVAMGELVDDAIVDVENIFRRLKENNAAERPRSALQVVYDASREIRSAIVFGTMVIILVFLPLFALSGVEGRLFAPLGVAYIVSILASLLVSLTVTPVLSYYLLPQSKATHREGDGPLLRAEVGSEPSHSIEHGARGHPSGDDLDSGRFRGVGDDTPRGGLPAAVRRRERSGQRDASARLVIAGVESNRRRHRRALSGHAANRGQPARRDSTLRPPHRPSGTR
jgi:HME family heavy-metal exporter